MVSWCLGTLSLNKNQLQEQKKVASSVESSDSSKKLNKTSTLESIELDENNKQMQAYHQSFNPQAYISNTNGAAAAVAAAAYYQHHNPANYVIPSQYSIADGFGYGAGNSTAAAAAALAGGSPQAYNGQQVNKNEKN